MIFDDENRLNLRVGNQTVGALLVTVEASGATWVSADRNLSIDFALPNRR